MKIANAWLQESTFHFYADYQDVPVLDDEWFTKAKTAKSLDQLKAEAAAQSYYQELAATTGELTSQMFEDAIAHIEEHGWCQGVEVNKTGAVCAYGAFGLATVEWTNEIPVRHGSHDRQRVFTVRQREILELMGIPFATHTVVSWNDADGRTKDEVIDALTRAAKTLRDEGR